jgi:hypothetical protein
MNFPFEEKKIEKKIFLREFKESINSDELIWHLDREDREIFILESNGWKLQMDNELPKELVRGDTHFIPKMTYHRVIKGDGDLKIRLTKLEDK